MSKAFDILVIEDESDLRDAVVGFLAQMGNETAGVDSVEAAERWLERNDASVLVLDLSLPGESGLEWLQRRVDLKEKGIMMVTAAGSDAERIAGRAAGADGYFVKPVNLVELGMSVKNLLERLRVADRWMLDSLTWELTAPNGKAAKLTASELTLMECLAEKPGGIVERATIIERLGEDPDAYDIRRMEVMIRRLRTKISETLSMDPPISTVRATGYAFTAKLDWAGETVS